MYIFVCHDITKVKELHESAEWLYSNWEHDLDDDDDEEDVINLGYSSNPKSYCMLANWFATTEHLVLSSMAHSHTTFKWKFWG